MSESKLNVYDVQYLAVTYYHKKGMGFTVSELYEVIVENIGEEIMAKRTLRRTLNAGEERNYFRKDGDKYIPCFSFESTDADVKGKFQRFESHPSEVNSDSDEMDSELGEI